MKQVIHLFGYIKRVAKSMVVPLCEATRIKVFVCNLMDGVEPTKNSPSKCGIFTIDEIIRIVTFLRDKPLEGRSPLNVYLATALTTMVEV